MSGAPATDFAGASAGVKATLHASALRGLDTRSRSRDWPISERRKISQLTSILSTDTHAKTEARMHLTTRPMRSQKPAVFGSVRARCAVPSDPALTPPSRRAVRTYCRLHVRLQLAGVPAILFVRSTRKNGHQHTSKLITGNRGVNDPENGRGAASRRDSRGRSRHGSSAVAIGTAVGGGTRRRPISWQRSTPQSAGALSVVHCGECATPPPKVRG